MYNFNQNKMNKTYKTIQELYRKEFNKTIKTCWIADVKRELGLTTRISSNRINRHSVKCPCPSREVRNRIKKIIIDN